MKQHNRLFQLLSRWVLLSLMLSIALPTKAQPIQGDNTLGTQVNTRGTTFVITGGTTVHTNLFHSFGSFSVPKGAIADFQADPAIANILARVTGGQPSDIDGQIRSLSKANLFLMNPNGILFGTNARLNVGGSFVGTTANAIQFPNGGEFSPTSSVSDQSSLLKVNPSALLFTQLQPARIENRSVAPSVATIPETPLPIQVAGLSVPAGKSLLLIGGDILMDGGRLNALRGRVELASVAGKGTIGLAQDSNQRLALSPIPDTVSRGNVTLVNQAQINLATAIARVGRIVIALGSIGDDVTIQAGNASLENSTIASGTIGQNKGGMILIHADTISLSQNSRITSQTTNTGSAGDIALTASNRITIENSTLLSPTKSSGAGGNIHINAAELNAVNSTINAGTEGLGNAGNILVNVSNGVNFNRTNLSTGGQLGKALVGRSGNVNVQARSLTLDDSSNIFSSNAGENSAGNITLVIRGKILLANGSQISSEALRSGRGGNIILNADSLEITDSFVRSATSGLGNAGNIQATVRDRVSVDVDQVDQVNRFRYPVGLSASTNSGGSGGTIEIKSDQIELQGKPGSRSGLFAAATNTGAAGDIALSTRQLTVRDGAQVSVESSTPQTGQAGNLRIDADSITLDNQGKITAETASGDGGNLNLNVRNVLLLRRNSLVSTTAGTSEAGGDGGNITITSAPFIVAIPSENSDIRANAFRGKGGNVSIATRGLFGIQYRPLVLDTPESDITASSQYGINGTVTITTPDVDPNRGLIELPANLVDTSNQISQGCAPRGGQMSSFVATGRGGLPLSPNEPLQNRSTTSEWVSIAPDSRVQPITAMEASPRSSTSPQPKIVEAQGWIKKANGQVVLVDQVPTVSEIDKLQPTACLAH